MIVRWLGAFGFGSDLQTSIDHELTLALHEVVCAEPIKKEIGSQMPSHVRVGLLVSNKAVIRKFRSDMYSVRDKQKSIPWMKTSRDEGDAYSNHAEAWVRPIYKALVIRAGGSKLAGQTLQILRQTSEKYSLPILKLSRTGELIPVRIKEVKIK